MLNKRIIAIDVGKFACKASTYDVEGNVKNISFRTKVEEYNAMNDVDLQGNTFEVEYQGKKYRIGNMANENVSLSTSKKSDDHKLAALLAISQLVEETKSEFIQLIIGFPITSYLNKDEREGFREMFKREGSVEIKVNGRKKAFFISDVTVLPESSGIVYLLSDSFRKERTLVLDIGGLNVNGCVYGKDLAPEVNTMFTTNSGSFTLEKSVGQALKTAFDTSLDENFIRETLEKGFISYQGQEVQGSRQIINEEVNKHVSKIIREIMRQGIDPNVLPVIVIGGSSKILQAKIKEQIRHVQIADNPQFANVKGFLKVGRKVYV